MKSKRMFWFRYMLQLVSLVSFVVLIADLSYPLGEENLVLQWFSRIDPWFLLSHLRWQQEVPSWVWVPLLTLASTLLWGRIFCGWLCPFGALLALIDKIGQLVFKNMPLRRSKVLQHVQSMRNYWMIFLVIVFVLGSNWGLYLTPFALFSHEAVWALQGKLPWMLIGIIVSTLLFSRLWCSVLCPTGLLLSFIAKMRLFRYQIKGNCIHCEKCVKGCSVGAAPESTEGPKEWCLVCGNCQEICPTKVIKWQRSSVGEKNSQGALDDDSEVTVYQRSRRQFLKVTFAVALAGAFWKEINWKTEKALRPPGALPELEFSAVCNRCGRCMQVCPSQALRPMPITAGFANFETPYIIPRQNRCDLCLACQEVCPTGAIAEVPLQKIQMGKAVIDNSRCIAWSEGKLCFICGEQCPVLAINGDERHRPTVLSDQCVGCGSCENACPIDGEAAIRIFPS